MIDTNSHEVQYWGRDFLEDNRPYFAVRRNNGTYAEYFRLDPDSAAFDFLAHKVVNGLDISGRELASVGEQWERITKDVDDRFNHTCINVIHDNHLVVKGATTYMDSEAAQLTHKIVKKFKEERKYADISEALLVKTYARYAAEVKGNGPRAHSHDIMSRVINFARHLEGSQLNVGADIFYRTTVDHNKFASFACGKVKKITETGVRLYYSSRIVTKNGSTIVEYFGNGPFIPFAQVIGNVVDTKLTGFWPYTKLTAQQYRDLANIA